MATNPELAEFEKQLDALRAHRLIAPHLKRSEVHLGGLSLKDVAELARDDVAYYFLIAAAGLNRTSLKRALTSEAAGIVEKSLRRAYAIRERLPVRASLVDVAKSAALLRRADIDRRSKGSVESLFRERLAAEGIPILMSPPVRQVPGLLIGPSESRTASSPTRRTIWRRRSTSRSRTSAGSPMISRSASTRSRRPRSR